ncbi:hypothetical protein [Nostoc sp.]|uniref:hypothetical protein n=1 Tax=Nostoc sp. TaxID=1180 RepID=UPI002FF7A6EC
MAFAIIMLPLSAIAQTARIQSIAGTGKVRVQREKRMDWLPVRSATELSSRRSNFSRHWS